MTIKRMLRATLVLLTLWMVQTAMLSVARAASDLYTGLILIDPVKETRTADSYVLVTDGRIAATGTGVPPASLKAVRIHDFSGRYALPGFIDAHAHITAGPQQIQMRSGAPLITNEGKDDITQHSARIALAFGVTTLRNPGGDPEANARYDRAIASGAWIGPEALHAGAVIQPPPMGGASFAYPRSEIEWQAEAAREAALGMRYFKLYVGLSEVELETGIRVAHQHGLKAIAHLNTISWTRAAQLGIDGLEHALPTSPDLLEPPQRELYVAELGPNSKFMYRWFELVDYDGPLMQELFALLSRKRVVVNLTLLVNKLIYNADDLELAFPSIGSSVADLEKLMHPEMKTNLEMFKASAAGWTQEDYRRARAVMPKVLEFARRLHQLGVPMIIGTDGLGGGPHYAQELALHVEAGIPVWEVLRMSTSGAADVMGIGHRTGRLEPGFEADIAFLNADPILDIVNAAKVYGVLNNGRFLLSADLTEDAQ
ncbi:amidohydrolase family protein [Steroidobacter agaridevorans]|nr:amidohydrolase family protein [Steroidobacter agaridevorans]